jgi:hypothetical protein
MPDPGLSILVVSWNTRDLLRRCVESIAPALEALDAEAIVVDNASSDGSAGMVRERFGSDPRVTLIANPANEGFSRANNAALARARGGVIVLANPDLELSAGLLAALRRHLDDHPEAGLVTCRLIDPEGRPQAIHRAFPSLALVFFCRTRPGRWLDRRLLRGRFARCYRPQPDGAAGSAAGWARIDQAAGALMALRRSTIDEVGGLFDERFPILGGDVDLCRRIRDAGYEVHCLLDRAAVHHGGASLGQVPAATREEWWWHFIRLYYRLHEPRWRRGLLALVGIAR